MKTGIRVAIGTLLALVLSGATAQAGGDFCITETGGGAFTFVATKFKVPSHGKCTPWVGFVSSIGDAFPTTGMGCTASDSSEVSISITTAPIDGSGDSFVDYFKFALPSLANTLGFEATLGVGNGASDSSTFTTGTVTAGPCSPSVIPIP
jgi:hypothetical protein